MFSKGIRRYISNPAIGLLPILLYITLHTIDVKEGKAILIALIFAILSEICVRVIYKNKIFSFTFFVSASSLFLTFVTWLFTNKIISNTYTYIIVCEIFIIGIIALLRISKNYFEIKVFSNKDMNQKAFLNEFYMCCKLFQYAFTIHIFLISIYEQFINPKNRLYGDISDIVIFIIYPILSVLAIGLFQFMKINKIAQKLEHEEWLPIVTEKGEVTGKIAKKVSLNMKNQFLHPVVRIALISDNKIYLQERSENNIIDSEKLDYPFEKYMLFKHDINLAARNCMSNMLYNNEIDGDLKFVLKYVFENSETKRLIFLFTMKIKNEESIKRTKLMYGKFWSVKQIENELGNKIFSECFELEFEYLKNIIFVEDGAKESTPL